MVENKSLKISGSGRDDRMLAKRKKIYREFIKWAEINRTATLGLVLPHSTAQMPKGRDQTTFHRPMQFDAVREGLPFGHQHRADCNLVQSIK